MLRQLRKQAGLSGARLAARCNMSQSKVSRIEGNRVRPSLVDVDQILKGLGASPAVAAEAMAMARIAQTEWQDRKALHRKGLDKKQLELAGLEAATTDFRFFLLSMITGLLSTPEYIRASIFDAPPTQQARAVGMKLERQAVLLDRSKRFTFILTEQAVRYPLVAPDTMAMQIDHICRTHHAPSGRRWQGSSTGPGPPSWAGPLRIDAPGARTSTASGGRAGERAALGRRSPAAGPAGVTRPRSAPAASRPRRRSCPGPPRRASPPLRRPPSADRSG
ncbi:Scr1 family TA system antitoxin-like transcriptional regulator [Streptomyces sp. S1A(2023)]